MNIIIIVTDIMFLNLLVLLAAGYVQGATFPDADTRVVGGKAAPEGAYPYQVSMWNVKDQEYHFCGGSIIGKKWILTAAHCLKKRTPDSFVVIVGTNKLSSGGKRYKVDSFISHENYNIPLIMNDIALVKLTEELEYTDKVQPIAVGDTYVDGGQKCTLTGWGYINKYQRGTDNLQTLQVTVLSVSECKEKLAPTRPAKYTEDEICALDGRGLGTCQGDSGGPLVCNGTVSGITSWNIPCGRGLPDVYTRVSSYIDWIKKNTGGE